MKKLIGLLCLLLLFQTCTAQPSILEVRNAINTKILTNQQRLNSSAKLREVLHKMVDYTDSNYVDRWTNQNINGRKSFTEDVYINGLRAGRGPGADTTNTVFGYKSGKSIVVDPPYGRFNVLIGDYAGAKLTDGSRNTVVGSIAGENITYGLHNTLIGTAAGSKVVTCYGNTFVGANSGQLYTGQFNYDGDNTFLGERSGGSIITGLRNTFLGGSAGEYVTGSDDVILIGYGTHPLNNAGSVNEIVIGNDQVGHGSNTTTIGNYNTTKTRMYGNWENPGPGQGILLRTPDNTKTYLITINNAGAIIATLQ